MFINNTSKLKLFEDIKWTHQLDGFTDKLSTDLPK